jgi:hypothetical protein
MTTTAEAKPKPPKPRWEWARAAGHDQQPLAEWWVEQIVGRILTRIAMRSLKRGDRQTFDRIYAIVMVAAKEEQLAEMRKP